MRRRWTLCWSPNYLKWKLKPLELMIMSQNAVADEIEIPVTQPVLLLVLSPVHGLLRRCMQGAENRTLEPVTSIRLKIEESWYASMDCKVQKSGPWVCFYGGHSTGYKLGHHPKNIEPCAHRARTVRQRPPSPRENTHTSGVAQDQGYKTERPD